jgi:hypothetical protein
MSNYDLLKQKIQEATPRLLEMSKGQLFTIKNMPFHYEFLHFIYNDDEEIVEIATLYNGEIATLYNGEVDLFDYEYFTNQQITIYGKEPMLNDVLEWLKSISEYTDEYCITIGGDFLKMNFIQSSFELINSHTNPRWDMSKPYLKDQSSELIEWLSTLG